MTTPDIVVPHMVLREFCRNALASLNVRDDVLSHVTESLLQSSLRGIDSHGIELLPHYYSAVRSGRINGNPKYDFSRSSPSTGKLDRAFSQSPTIASFWMPKPKPCSRPAILVN